MSTLLAFVILVLLVGSVVVLLERNHRRSDVYPSLPLGANPVCDTDVARVRHDLDAAG